TCRSGRRLPLRTRRRPCLGDVRPGRGTGRSLRDGPRAHTPRRHHRQHPHQPDLGTALRQKPPKAPRGPLVQHKAPHKASPTVPVPVHHHLLGPAHSPCASGALAPHPHIPHPGKPVRVLVGIAMHLPSVVLVDFPSVTFRGRSNNRVKGLRARVTSAMSSSSVPDPPGTPRPSTPRVPNCVRWCSRAPSPQVEP